MKRTLALATLLLVPFAALQAAGNPHVPHEALPADKALYASLPEKEQNYYGEITGIDRSVGRLRAALRELQVANNTRPAKGD